MSDMCSEGVVGCPCRTSHKHARPDAAPPKKGDAEITEDIFGNRWVTGVVGMNPPPSDAAPVAQQLFDTMPELILAVLRENGIDPLSYAEKWAEAIGPLYAHPEDAPEDDPFKEAPPTDADEPPWKGWYSCEDCNGWFYGDPTCYENGVEVCQSCGVKREDAPGGPWT